VSNTSLDGIFATSKVCSLFKNCPSIIEPIKTTCLFHFEKSLKIFEYDNPTETNSYFIILQLWF
jgi:hypothetical protein